MPYGDLTQQVVQRFSSYADFDRHRCTIEEREEYEPIVAMGAVVYAGIDYELILRQAEQEADIIVWDGGNNDTPFFKPDIHMVVFDPHRAGHETTYHPGETNLLMADVAVINKIDSAAPEKVEAVRAAIQDRNPAADIVLADSAIRCDHPESIKGRRVLVIEDGPTLTHGEMSFGAGTVAAQRYGAAETVDPRPYLEGSLKETFAQYPHMGNLLPAMGYSQAQIHDMQTVIDRVPCDLVLLATPIDLTRLLSIDRSTLRIRYEYQDHGEPTLEHMVIKRLGASDAT
jgi:predicted GTPase